MVTSETQQATTGDPKDSEAHEAEPYTECQGMCGLDKILGDIREEFPKCSRNRAYKLQKEHGLYSVRKTIQSVPLTDSNHDLPIAENLLNQKFDISESQELFG